MLDGNNIYRHANAPFCEAAAAVQQEVDIAIQDGWTIGEFVDHHIGPKSHNFLPSFTTNHITREKRVFHDPCHPFVALGYKKLGIDTSQFIHWYNGNEHAESLTVPFEVFFNDLMRPKKIFSLEYYIEEVHSGFRKNGMKDKATLQRAARVANVSDDPISIFSICRDAHFDTEKLILSAASAFREAQRKGISIPAEGNTTKWGERIPEIHHWSDKFLTAFHDAVLPSLHYARTCIEPCLKDHTGEKGIHTAQRALNNVRMDKAWMAINSP